MKCNISYLFNHLTFGKFEPMRKKLFAYNTVVYVLLCNPYSLVVHGNSIPMSAQMHQFLSSFLKEYFTGFLPGFVHLSRFYKTLETQRSTTYLLDILGISKDIQ